MAIPEGDERRRRAEAVRQAIDHLERRRKGKRRPGKTANVAERESEEKPPERTEDTTDEQS